MAFPATHHLLSVENLEFEMTFLSCHLLLRRLQVMLAGGYSHNVVDGGYQSLASVELLAVDGSAWRPAHPLLTARDGAVAGLLRDGKVIIAGGEDIDDVPLASAELYDPTADKWSTLPAMRTPRNGAVSCVLESGRFVVLDANDVDTSPTITGEVFHPEGDGSWNALPPTEADMVVDGVVAVPGGFLIIGAEADQDTQYGSDRITGKLFDVALGRWFQLPRSTQPKPLNAAVVTIGGGGLPTKETAEGCGGGNDLQPAIGLARSPAAGAGLAASKAPAVKTSE